MRFILTLVIWLVIVGGLWLYTQQRDAAIGQAAASLVDLTVDETITIELTSTFNVEEDPFALQTDDTPSLGIELKLNGSDIPLSDQSVQRGQVIRIDDVSGVLKGHNELYLKASPPAEESNIDQGVRVRLLINGDPVEDHTMWSTSGALVSGGFSFEYNPDKEEPHDH